MKTTKVNVGVALEGTISGAINRTRFANKISYLAAYTKLLDYTEHKADCDKAENVNCSCGLDEFLRTGME